MENQALAEKPTQTGNRFLTEETYQRVNKKIKTVALTVLVLGLVIGGILIALGAIKQSEANKINEERAAAAQAESEARVAEAEQRLAEISNEQTTLNKEYNAKSQECDALDMSSADWFAKNSQCQREASEIYSQIGSLKTEQFRLENDNYAVYYDIEQPEKYIPLYVVGGVVILLGAGVSLVIWLVTKRRALRAYGAQQTLPVNREIVSEYTGVAVDALDKAAPTIGKVAGDIAGSVAEGVVRGKANVDSNKNQPRQ